MGKIQTRRGVQDQRRVRSGRPQHLVQAAPLPLPGTGLEALLAKGVLIGACNMALTVYSGMVAQSMGMEAAAVKADWIANLIPGIQVVPSGVLAVSGTQEKGCAYCFAG